MENVINKNRLRTGETLSPIDVSINSKLVNLTPIKDKDSKGILVYRDRNAVGPHGQWFKAKWPSNAGALAGAEVICMTVEAAPAKAYFSNKKQLKQRFSAMMIKPEGGGYEMRLESDKDEQTVGFKNKDGENMYLVDKGFRWMTESEFLETQATAERNRVASEAAVKARDPNQWRKDFAEQNQDILRTLDKSIQAMAGGRKGAPA